jgi:peptidoglycan/LPS O-acetylase OafA/YrhL
VGVDSNVIVAAPRPASAKVSPERIASLDGLRAFGVAIVVAYHCIGKVASGGRLGVDVFFPLSGFLITRIVAREIVQTGGLRIVQFYWRRLLRLYPALLATIVLTLGFFPLMTRGGSFGDWLQSAVFAGSYTMDVVIATGRMAANTALSPTWTLAMEEQFYLIWPLVLVLLLRRRIPTTVSLVATLVLLAASWGSLLAAPFAEFRPDLRAGALLVGCAAALAVSTKQVPRFAANAVLWVAPPLLVGVVAVVSRTNYVAPAVATIAVSSLTAAVVPALLVSRRHLVARVLSVGCARWLGRRSYAVYLVHVPVLQAVVGATGWGSERAAIVAVPVILLIAESSYRWVELPALRLRDRRERPRSDQ